jgi:O-acetyl-ADP-ribose deacetylase (regulator of RNase III)
VIVVRQGDLLGSDAQALVCPTNTAGPMGAGLARAFRDRFPGLERDYRAACGRGEVRLGRVWRWVTLLGPEVVCLPTKGHWTDPARLDDVDQGLADLAAQARAAGIGSLAVPALGCGGGGLAWRRVAPLLHRHLAPLAAGDVNVEVYAPLDVPAVQATVGFLADPPPRVRAGRVVRCSRAGRVPAGAVYVGRAWQRGGLAGSPLANPFRLADPDDPAARRACLERYRAWLYAHAARPGPVRAALEQLCGVDLACWCAPRPCHAELILAWLLRHPDPFDERAGRIAAALAAAPPVLPGERLGVVGSVRFASPDGLAIARLIVLDEVLRVRPARLTSGGAVGVDTVAERLGDALGIPVDVHQPVPPTNPPSGASRFVTKGFHGRDVLVARGSDALLRVFCRMSPTYGSGWTADEVERLGRPVWRVGI